jgi:hypothetical protein
LNNQKIVKLYPLRQIYSQQGGMLKTWRKRDFIIFNAKNNYKIEYYENPGGRMKGSICGAGYSVIAFDQFDTEKYGPHGLKLVPFQPQRRTWVFRAENDQLRSEWLMVFQHACFMVTTRQTTISIK